MYVSGITEETLKEITRRVSHANYGGNVTLKESATIGRRVRFTLRVSDSKGPGSRTSASGRHGPHACWHAHRDVLAGIFAENENAKVTSALASYPGRDAFYAMFPGTAYGNVGSAYRPVTMPSLCECDE